MVPHHPQKRHADPALRRPLRPHCQTQIRRNRPYCPQSSPPSGPSFRRGITTHCHPTSQKARAHQREFWLRPASVPSLWSHPRTRRLDNRLYTFYTVTTWQSSLAPRKRDRQVSRRAASRMSVAGTVLACVRHRPRTYSWADFLMCSTIASSSCMNVSWL